MNWYAIRTVYHWGQKSDGFNVFEERVVVFQAENEAFSKAKKEAKAYSTERSDRHYVMHPEQVLYRLDENVLIDGYEVWSDMFEAKENLDQFYENRYTKYVYHPE